MIYMLRLYVLPKDFGHHYPSFNSTVHSRKVLPGTHFTMYYTWVKHGIKATAGIQTLYLVVQSQDKTPRSQHLYNAQFWISVKAMLNTYWYKYHGLTKEPSIGHVRQWLHVPLWNLLHKKPKWITEKISEKKYFEGNLYSQCCIIFPTQCISRTVTDMI